MTRLDDYRSALKAGFSAVPNGELTRELENRGPEFVAFIIDNGLGPLWHTRTGRKEFRQTRLLAEALYAAQENALSEVNSLLASASIDHAVFKGAANRLLVYDNPAIRACHDIDLLVRPQDRIRAAAALVGAGFRGIADPLNIGHEITFSKGPIDLDLHWGLLRDGRLRRDSVSDMLDRRRQVKGFWALSAEDELFVLLVHPVFSKHLAAREMGLHRVLDIVMWFHTQSSDWALVCERLEQSGARTAAWATLRWVDLLAALDFPCELGGMLTELRPGHQREAWIDHWLQCNLSERTARAHWARLLGFSLFVHDTPADALRALAGRQRAKRRQAHDLAAFGKLLGQ